MAKKAAVSPRTFHNCFSSSAHTLLYFTAGILNDLAFQLPSLFRLGEALENFSMSREEKKTYAAAVCEVVSACHARFPEHSPFRMAVLLQSQAAAARVALQQGSEPTLTKARCTPEQTGSLGIFTASFGKPLILQP